MSRLSFSRKLVVVTGASSGLGRDIARRLALEEGAELVVAARRRERLEELAAEVHAAGGLPVHCLAVDLATCEGVEALYREAVSHGDVFGLVNCAGVTWYGATLDAPRAQTESIIALDLVAGVRLTNLFLRDFLDRRSGAILTVTSLAALLPLPWQNVYAAAKHGMQSFMEGLAREYRGRGVTFTTFLPGGIATEMISLAGLDRKVAMDSPVNMKPGEAARRALSAWKKGTDRSVPGLLNKTVAAFAKLAPRAFVSWTADKVYRL